MAALGVIATVASSALSLMGAAAQADAARQQGEMEQQAKEFQAKQLEQQANESRAASQRQMEEERHKADLASSRIQNVAAASGGSATDDTVIKLDEDVQGQGEYKALAQMYNGENRGRGFEMQAAGARYDGEIARQAGEARAQAALIGGFGDAFGKFAKASPFSMVT